MSKADDIIRRGRERVDASGETTRKEAETLKKIEDQRNYVDAKSALKMGDYPDKQAKEELKELAGESKKSQTTWQEKHSARDTVAMRTSQRPDDGSSGKSICFIATAVYGDINAPEVEALRSYRDNVLMRSNAGRRFIDLYYSGLGERIAYFVREKIPESIPTIKRCLDHLVERIEAGKK